MKDNIPAAKPQRQTVLVPAEATIVTCCGFQPQRLPRQAVLVLIHGDNFIEVFGGETADVKILQLPSVQSVKAEILIEELTERSLPGKFRDVFYANCKRAVHCIRPMTVQDVAAAETDRKIFSVLRGFASPAEVTSWV